MDGINIFQIPFEYSRVIGYVPQSIYLVDGTVKENVAFGVDEEKIDDKLVWQALRQARLDGFVRECEDELDTILGERGVRFLEDRGNAWRLPEPYIGNHRFWSSKMELL